MIASIYEDPDVAAYLAAGEDRVRFTCWLCEGTGEDPDQPPIACPVCAGEGETHG